MGCGTAESVLPVLEVEPEEYVTLDVAAELDIVAAKVKVDLWVLLDVDDSQSVNEADEDSVPVELGVLLVGVTDETTAVEDKLDGAPVLLACAVVDPPAFGHSAPTPLPAKNKPMRVEGSASVF